MGNAVFALSKRGWSLWVTPVFGVIHQNPQLRHIHSPQGPWEPASKELTSQKHSTRMPIGRDLAMTEVDLFHAHGGSV